MNKFNKLSLLLLMFLCFETQAQIIITRVEKIEIDRRQVKKDYKVFLYSNGKRFQAARTKDGFIVPDELENEEYLGAEIIFGKHKLDFSNIHISNFTGKWIIGVDKKPFSNETITPEEAKTTKLVYYIKFTDEEPGRLLVVTIK